MDFAKDQGHAYERLNHAGIARIALKCEDVKAAYQELKAKGFTFFSEPREAHFPKWYVVSFAARIPTEPRSNSYRARF